MNKTALGCGLAVFVLCVSNTKASEFDGFYVGANVGSNKSTATLRPDKTESYVGAVAGYNWDFQSFLLGANAFVDAHSSAYSGKDAGMDVKLGLPMKEWLPYAKLGLTDSEPGTRAHAGLGVEYKFYSQWSINGEWMRDKKSIGPVNYENNNFVIGVNYYFGESISSAAAREAAAREAAARDAEARDAAAREAAAREAAAREAAASEAAASEAVASEAVASEAVASEAEAREAEAREAEAKEAEAKEAAAKEAAAKDAAAREAAAEES